MPWRWRERRPCTKKAKSEASWILLDYGSVIAHIFTPEERDYYRLDRLWGDAPAVVKMQ